MHDSTSKNIFLALCFALFSTGALAAKLGDITVLSAQGQPLNAEIALFPANEEELAGISARIASAEVFAEQGLTRAAELDAVRVVVGVRADGQPIVQLFSTAPINTSALDMLVQVDSSAGGSLVRKYALALEAAPAESAPAEVALPDAPVLPAPEEAMSEPEPVMEAPETVQEEAMIEEAAPEEVIEEREATIEEMTADVSGIEAPEDEPSAIDEDADLAIDDMQAEDMSSPVPDEPEEMMAEESADDMTTDDMQAQDMTEVDEIEPEVGEEIAEVTEDLPPLAEEIFNPENPVEAPPAPAITVTAEKGDTLRKLATQYWHEDVSLEQMMAGIYRANPQAFKKGNPERIKVGEIVRVPSADEIKAIDQAEAESFVHAKNWNAYRNKLADTVAKSAPVKDSASSSVASGKIATVRDQAEAAHEPRDVVKLSGDADKAVGNKMSKAAMEEELAARENALRESNERIALLEKQLADANALVEAQKKATAATAAEPAKEQAKPEAAKTGMITTLQENLQKHPDMKAKILGVLAILLALFLFLRNRSKGDNAPKKPDAPTAETGGAALTEASAVDQVEVNQAEADRIAAEKAAADIAAGAAAVAAMQADAEPNPETETESTDVLDTSDLDTLLPDDEPEPEPVAEEPAAEPAQEASVEQAAAEEPIAEEPTADELVADMMAASDAVETPAAPEPVAADDDFDKVFESETALADMAAAMPESTAPMDEAAAARADEAATDMMAATAMEQGSVEADDQFALDDVFAEAAEPATVEPAITEPVAEKLDDLDDIFGSETALAEAVAEMPESAAPINEAAAAMADEAATDMMAATAMEEGSIEADDQFALDDVFGEAAPVIEMETPPEAAPDVPAADGDHSAALAAAFEETAKEDLSGLDFDFAAEMPEEEPAAPVAKTKTKKAAKPRAKKAAATPEVKLDLSDIDLDLAESAAADSAEVETKLDLVSAYMDMGDEDGARGILQEVIKEGSAAQIAKAKKLLGELG